VLKTQRKAAARVVEQKDEGMDFMMDSLSNASDLRHWNKLQNGLADFMRKEMSRKSRDKSCG
jgi:hypothetical protein